MRTARILKGWILTDYQEEYQCVPRTPSDGLEARLMEVDRWYKDNQYLPFEDQIVVPEARFDGFLRWTHLSSGHTCCNWSVDIFRECLYSRATHCELKSRMHSKVESCGCHASKQSDSRDRELVRSLPIPYRATSLVYVDYIHGVPRFRGQHSCLVVTSREFCCNKNITPEQTVRMLVEPCVEPYGTRKEVHSDEDVCTRSNSGW